MEESDEGKLDAPAYGHGPATQEGGHGVTAVPPAIVAAVGTFPDTATAVGGVRLGKDIPKVELQGRKKNSVIKSVLKTIPHSKIITFKVQIKFTYSLLADE